MKVIDFYKLTDKKVSEFFKFLQSQQTTKDPAWTNMWDDQWEDKANTLPYILTKTSKYKGSEGAFYIVYDGKKVIACGGVAKLATNALIALAGTRTWIAEEYRNQNIARNYLLPEHKAWAIKNNCKQVALTFNDYNKNIIAIWKRTRLGESRTPREPRHFCYSNFNEVPFPVTIQYTSQWVIYEKLDIEWKFDWQIIKSK
jgi:GNAT superfamily N-acetyltransferase